MQKVPVAKAPVGPAAAVMALCLLSAVLLCAAAPVAADTGLEAAREELRLRVETERRMREEFETLLARGGMSAADIVDFERYLGRLGTFVDEQRRVVAKLEGSGTAGLPKAAEPLPGDFDRGRTDTEKIAMLDAELGSSLSEFDEKLLREQQEIAEKSRAASTGDDGEGGGDGASGGEGEGEGESGGEGTEGQAGAEGEFGESGGESAEAGGNQGDSSGRDADAGEQGDAVGKSGESGDGSGGNQQVAAADGSEGNTPTTPDDIPDGSDDDIVARQLREAAENEKDPELREKLWEEYRKYKNR